MLITGLVASLLVGPAMSLFRVRDWRAQGLAAGTAGHGIATARMLLMSETAGAFGGLAIGLNGVITAIVVPLLASALAGHDPGAAAAGTMGCPCVSPSPLVGEGRGGGDHGQALFSHPT